MLRFFLDKVRESPGPLKQIRLVACDLAEEILDITEHYVKRGLGHDESEASAIPTPTSPPTQNNDSKPSNPPPAAEPAPTSQTSTAKPPASVRTLEVSEALAKALASPRNRKKQEFKVLAILFDAKNRKLGDLSAKKLSEHGEKLGVAIRHENVRKIIRMRLENYVKTLQDRAGAKSIYHYHITADGIRYFSDKYLK